MSPKHAPDLRIRCEISHCGIDNPIGLHLRFYTDDEGRCIARFQPRPEHQGYPGHLHGKIISTLLDVPTQLPIHSDPLSA